MDKNRSNNVHLIQDIKIIQHNVMHWTTEKADELFNYYSILLNSSNIINNKKIKIYNYNVIQKNTLNERHAGIAIAIKKI